MAPHEDADEREVKFTVIVSHRERKETEERRIMEYRQVVSILRIQYAIRCERMVIKCVGCANDVALLVKGSEGAK